jgi:hypothetical protein
MLNCYFLIIERLVAVAYCSIRLACDYVDAGYFKLMLAFGYSIVMMKKRCCLIRNRAFLSFW